MDTKAVSATGKMTMDIFKTVPPYLRNIHANEPSLGVLGISINVDHFFMGSLLDGLGHDEYFFY